MVHVIVTIFQGVIDEVEVFYFESDARKYYEDLGGSELEENPREDREVHWYQDVQVHSMPIENIEEIT